MDSIDYGEKYEEVKEKISNYKQKLIGVTESIHDRTTRQLARMSKNKQSKEQPNDVY